MKKLLFVAFLALAAVVACTPKASPSTTEATIPDAKDLSSSETTLAAGQVLFTTKCTKCHKAKDEAVASHTYEELRPVLASMVKKAKLNRDEIEQVSAYVLAHAKK